MTKTCTACGFSAATTGDILKYFKNDASYKFGVRAVCKRCASTGSPVVGEFCLLTEKPKPVKVCECCSREVHSVPELKATFRSHRSRERFSVDYVSICKRCEEVACQVLGEMKFKASNKLTLKRESEEYQELLFKLYVMNGYTEVPRNAYGFPVDVLKFNLRFCLSNGQPFITTGRAIRQVKLNAGYMPESETLCPNQ